MSRPDDHLLECLTEKQLLLEGLLSLMERERDLITALDAAGIEAGSDSKLQLIDLLERSKRSCEAALKAAARELGIPGAATLSELIASVDPPRRGRLEQAQKRLFELIGAVNRVNGFNRDLLYGSLSTVNRSLDFFRNRLGTVKTYGGDGRMHTGLGSGRLVCGEI